MKRLGIIVLFLFSLYGYTQVDATKDRKKGRVVIGGGFGLGFNRGFNIQANPEVGYRTKNLEFGLSLGLSYQTYNGTDEFYDPDFNSTLWNFGPYILFSPIPKFFLRGQYQYYTGKLDVQSDYYLDNKYDENTLWFGGGYQDRIAEHVYYRIGLMYNVLYDDGFDQNGRPNSIFSSGLIPIIGVSVGL